METANISFLNIVLCYCFSLEPVLQDMAQNKHTKEQIDAEVEGHQSMRQPENSRKRKSSLLLKIEKINLNYKL